MKWWVKLCFVLALIFTLTATTTFAARSPGTDDVPEVAARQSGSTDFINSLFPSIDSGGIEKLYTKYPIWNYTLDSDSAWYDPVTPAIMFVLNLMFIITTFQVRVTITIFEQAFTLDLLNVVADKISLLVDAYKKSSWDQFIGIVMPITGVVVLANATITYKRSKSFQQLLISILILGLSTLFFAYPKEILTKVNDVSKEVSAQVLAAGMPLLDSRASSINQSVVLASNNLWQQQVMYPWYLMQFTSVQTGKVKQDNFLPYAKGDKIRESNMDAEIDAGNWIMEERGIFARFIILTMSILWCFIVNIMICILSILVLASQLAPLALIILSPFILLLALFPYYGMTIIYKWTEQVLGAIFYKVVLSIFLSLFIIMSSVFFQIFNDYYMLQMVVQIVLVVMLILYRKKIIGIFTSVTKGPQAVGKAIEQPADIAGQLKRGAGRVASVAVMAASAYATGGISAGVAMGAKSGSVLQKAGRAMDTYSKAKRMKAVNPHAQDLLRHRFLEQKDAADTLASKTNTEPRYNGFVKSTMDRMEQGLPLFTEEQQSATAREILDVKKQGGKPERMFNPKNAPADNAAKYNTTQSRHFDRMDKLNTDFEKQRKKRLRIVRTAEWMANDTRDYDEDSNNTVHTTAAFAPLHDRGTASRKEDGAKPLVTSQFAAPSGIRGSTSEAGEDAALSVTTRFAETEEHSGNSPRVINLQKRGESIEHQRPFSSREAVPQSPSGRLSISASPGYIGQPMDREDGYLQIAYRAGRSGNKELQYEYLAKLDRLQAEKAGGVKMYTDAAAMPEIKHPSIVTPTHYTQVAQPKEIQHIQVKPPAVVKVERTAYAGQYKEENHHAAIEAEFAGSGLTPDEYIQQLFSRRSEIRRSLNMARDNAAPQEEISRVKRDFMDASSRYIQAKNLLNPNPNDGQNDA